MLMQGDTQYIQTVCEISDVLYERQFNWEERSVDGNNYLYTDWNQQFAILIHLDTTPLFGEIWCLQSLNMIHCGYYEDVYHAQHELLQEIREDLKDVQRG